MTENSGTFCTYHPMILKTLGCSLVYTAEQKEYFGRYLPAFTLKDPPREAASAIWKATSLHVHPDAFDYWIDILQVLNNKHPLSIKVIVISGSDYPIRDEHIEFWTALFPSTHFFIQNFCGTHPNCSIFPIGSFYPTTLELSAQKSETLTITYFNPDNSEERTLLAQYIEQTPELQVYQKGKLENEAYEEALRQARFSVCPVGNGFDTMRFWESLAKGAIPIVLANDFTLRLKEQFPHLPFLVLKSWHHLLAFQQQDVSTLYTELREEFSDLSPVQLTYWIEQLETRLLTPT